MELDFEKLEGLLRVFVASSARKLKVETGDLVIKAKRAKGGAFVPAEPEPAEQAAELVEAQPQFDFVCSDRVGIFYHGLAPEEEPAVGVGDHVARKSQVGCVLSIGVVNPLISNVEGKVVEVLVPDGQPVEYGEPVFKLEVSPGEGQ